MGRVYLDWNATAPPREQAMATWLAVQSRHWGNASSLHEEGRSARAHLEAARTSLAAWSQTRPSEWILTSGATESLHAALHGCLRARAGRRRVVTSQGEHSATLGICARLEQEGCEVVRVPLRRDGTWAPEAVLEAAEPATTALVSLIWANNETGAISDVAAVASALRARRIPLHLDAVQCPGRIPVDLSGLPASLLSLSAHKFGAPKGIGALFVRTGTPWKPWMLGGNQEGGRRSGTSNAAGAAALAAALDEASRDDFPAMARSRDHLEALLRRHVPDVVFHAWDAPRLPNTSCFALPGADSSTVLDRLDARGFAVSSGSACTTGKTDPSHVLLAMGIPPELAHATLRVSLGPTTQREDLDRFVPVLAEEAAAVRAL